MNSTLNVYLNSTTQDDAVAQAQVLAVLPVLFSRIPGDHNIALASAAPGTDVTIPSGAATDASSSSASSAGFGTASASQQQQAGQQSSKPSFGFVFGIFLACLFSVLAMGIILYLYRRHRIQWRQQHLEDEVNKLSRTMEHYSIDEEGTEGPPEEQNEIRILSDDDDADADHNHDQHPDKRNPAQGQAQLFSNYYDHPQQPNEDEEEGHDPDEERDTFPMMLSTDSRLTRYQVRNSREEPVLHEAFEASSNGSMFVRRKYTMRIVGRAPPGAKFSCDEYDTGTVASETQQLK